MTFSIVACDLEDQAWGVAVASKFPAVGAVVPWARADAGAVATQSFANTSFGNRSLDMMTAGMSADEALAALLAHDDEREQRQVGLVDPHGRAATFTGSKCFDWAGGVSGAGYAVQGNILAGPRVVAAVEKKFIASKGDLPHRLHAALLAGDRAGGDRRGRQSAAIYVVKAKAGYAGIGDRWIDYRVDDHEDPVVRLGELIELNYLYFEQSPEADRVKLTGASRERVERILKLSGYLKKGAPYERAFREFIGKENFEERADPDGAWIDRPVLKFLLKKFEK